ncbi:fungal-specific transcription factor domain-containing protein [Aspergillus californicus]
MTNAISRARTGCWTCRSRRTKCDETRPVCRRCTRINASCGYGVRLTWHEESLARGVCHGRAAVQTARSRDLSIHRTNRQQPRRLNQKNEPADETRWVFLNTSINDLEIYMDLPRYDTSLLSPSLNALNALPPENRSRSQYDPGLLSFFESIICSSSTLVDNAHCNPYRYLILPMALTSTGLYHATLAIAANTLRLSNPLYRIPALEHHHRALNYLRNLLAQTEWTERDLDEMIGLVLMLCWFEISNNSSPSWVTHLNGYQDLLRTRQQRRPPRSVHSEQLSSFFNRYFAFHLVLARTAFRLDHLPLPPVNLLHHRGEEIDPDVIDTYMGLSHSLLLLINRVAEMAWSDSGSRSMASWKDIQQVKEQLEVLRQIPPMEKPIDTECVAIATAIAEANRLGALLLLHEIRSSRYPGPSRERKMEGTDTDGKTRCVKQILSLMLEKRASIMRTAVLPLWPLFLAGCCVSEEADRVTVMRLFEEVEGIRRFGNIAPAMEVVQMVWRQRDLSAQDERKPGKKSNMKGRFEWERAMTMLGNWKLSLT